MNRFLVSVVCLTATTVGLVGCGNVNGTNLLFVSHQKAGVGIHVVPSIAEGLPVGFDGYFGYKGKDMAVVPVTAGDNEDNPARNGDC